MLFNIELDILEEWEIILRKIKNCYIVFDWIIKKKCYR